MITLRKSVRVIPLGIAMGIIVLVMNFRAPRLVRRAAADHHRRTVRLFRRTDERPAPASRPHPDGRRPLDRRAELQRKPVDPDDDRVYYLMVKFDLSIYWVITLFGSLSAAACCWSKRRHEANQREHDDVIHLTTTAADTSPPPAPCLLYSF